jgi:DNA-binding response OmpR family regulator
MNNHPNSNIGAASEFRMLQIHKCIAILDNEPDLPSHLMQMIEGQLRAIDAPVTCVLFRDGDDLRRMLRHETFDLLVLEWQTPGLDSAELLHWLRKIRNRTPVMVLGSLMTEHEVAEALNAGADDYVANPFRPAELGARIHRLVTSQLTIAAVERFGAWRFERASYSVQVDFAGTRLTKKIVLTDTEFRLALLLFRNIGHPLSRAQLLEVIGQQNEARSRTLDSSIYRVRAKMGLDGSNGMRLQAIYGFGYRLDEVSGETGNPVVTNVN